MQETWVWSLDWEDALEKEMANHSSILAWRIPWAEEPGQLQSLGSQTDMTKVTEHACMHAYMVFLCLTILRVFYHKYMLNFVKIFFCIYWHSHVIFILYSVNIVYYLAWFVDSEPSLHIWNKSLDHDAWFFQVLLNSVCYYFVKNFCI